MGVLASNIPFAPTPCSIQQIWNGGNQKCFLLENMDNLVFVLKKMSLVLVLVFTLANLELFCRHYFCPRISINELEVHPYSSS